MAEKTNQNEEKVIDLKRFITEDFDKFNDKKTCNLKWPAKFTKQFYYNWINLGDSDVTDYKGLEYYFNIRSVKTPDLDVILIDYTYMGDNWSFLRDGSMTINIEGGENIKLEPNESNTEVSAGYHGAVVEVGYYPITKDQLKKVCDAKNIEVRVQGASGYMDLKNESSKGWCTDLLPANKFQFMCRAFYSGLFEDAAYNDYLVELVPPGTEAKAKAGAAGGGACFIATAAMGDYDHPAVMDLRMFRDNWLLKRGWGVKFTNWYYTHGPKAARVIDKSTMLKKITYCLVVKPLQVITKRLK